MFPNGSDHLLEDLVQFNDHLGWSQRLRSLDYFRCLEYQLVLRALGSISAECSLLLEWGVGTSPLPQYLAQNASVIAMDLDHRSCTWQAKAYKRREARHGKGFSTTHRNVEPPTSTTLTAVRANGLALPMATSSIDVAIAVGALEHTLEDLTLQTGTARSRDCGDTAALQELARVLKPGAALLMTVPWSTTSSYSKNSTHTQTFERRYDDQALVDRLIRPSGLREVSRSYFGEPGFPFSDYWYRLPFLLKLPFRRLMPWASSRFLTELSDSSTNAPQSLPRGLLHGAPSSAPDHACGVFLWLEKPSLQATPH